VAVIGPGGAGKSWLSIRLAERLGVPLVHLDRHFWRPGWIETERGEWRRMHAELLPADGAWVADGNYGGTLDLRLERADTVVLLDPHPAVAVARALWRQTLGTHPGAPPDRSRWGRPLLGFLRWIWSYRRTRLPGIERRLGAFRGDVHVLRTRADVRRFLAAITPARDAKSTQEADAEGDG
jgi:adenylate kinase family enzyme